ncbi:MAG: 1-(5-phosphoribosyl)-5-[(5-phosphoribosylamino)methylideneamino] imidazole-4-carboxamide isomerase [Pseudomonadota bacterium]
MIIYPDIELYNGQCVNLKHGSISEPKVFSISPQEAANEFAEAGAEWLHIVDMNRVFDHEGDNAEIIREIIKNSQIPVQVGGGLRSASAINDWLDNGAERVILGTAATTDARLVADVCTHHSEKIVISIDARSGKVFSHGWETESTFTALELAKKFESAGAAGIIYTDIDMYDELPESSMANTIEMATELQCPVISSGTIRSLDDVSMLSQLPNVSGAVTGWALFNKVVALEDVLAIANQARTKAEFI